MPNISRRKFVASGAAATIGFSGCLGLGAGGDYPSDTVKLIIPFGEGGGTDVANRNIMPAVSDELGINVQIENVPGAASLRGTGQMYNADPDGYTMGAFNPPSTPISALVQEPGFDLRELEGIAAYGISPYCMVANPKYEFSGLGDVIDSFADGEIDSLAGQGRGGPVHVMSLLIQDWLPWENYIPYDGSGAIIQSVLSDETPIGFTTPAEIVDPVEQGELDFITYMSSETTPAFEGETTIVDEGHPNIDFVSRLTRCYWFPPETPEEQVNTMSSAVEKAMQSDEITSWAEDTGFAIAYEGPEFANQILEDIYQEIPERVDLEEFRN